MFVPNFPQISSLLSKTKISPFRMNKEEYIEESQGSDSKEKRIKKIRINKAQLQFEIQKLCIIRAKHLFSAISAHFERGKGEINAWDRPSILAMPRGAISRYKDEFRSWLLLLLLHAFAKKSNWNGTIVLDRRDDASANYTRRRRVALNVLGVIFCCFGSSF